MDRIGQYLREGMPARHAATWVFGVVVLGLAVLVGISLLDPAVTFDALAFRIVGLALTTVLFIFHLRGHAWARIGVVAASVLLVGFGVSDPAAAERVPLAFLLPSLVGLAAVGPVVGALAAPATWLILVSRAGGGAYLDPAQVVILVLSVGLLGVARFTTVHETKEREREQTRAVQSELERDQAKSQTEERTRMFATMAHELGNVLSPLSLQIAVLERRAEQAHDERQLQSLKVLGRAREAAAALLRDMQDHARIEAGAVRLERHPVDAAAIVREAVEAQAGAAQEAGVDLEVRARAHAPVHTDAGRARQIITNLLSNAIKYSPPGGTVEVHVTPALEVVTVSVRDHGIGIPAERRSVLFQPFTQVHTEPGLQKPGTGLGLYISRQLAERLGGGLVVGTPPWGTGAEFVLALPMHTEVPPAVTLPAQ